MMMLLTAFDISLIGSSDYHHSAQKGKHQSKGIRSALFRSRLSRSIIDFILFKLVAIVKLVTKIYEAHK